MWAVLPMFEAHAASIFRVELRPLPQDTKTNINISNKEELHIHTG
jgi:hypothetical protein